MQVLRWLDGLSTASDVYTWLFQHRLFTPDELWEDDSGEAAPATSRRKGAAPVRKPPSALLDAVRHFLTVHAFDSAFGSTGPGFHTSISALTPQQLNQLHRARAIAVCRVFVLCATLCRVASPATLSMLTMRGVMSSRLYSLILRSVLEPAALGLDTVDSQVRCHDPRML